MTTGYDLLMSARWLLDGPEYDPDTGAADGVAVVETPCNRRPR